MRCCAPLFAAVCCCVLLCAAVCCCALCVVLLCAAVRCCVLLCAAVACCAAVLLCCCVLCCCVLLCVVVCCVLCCCVLLCAAVFFYVTTSSFAPARQVTQGNSWEPMCVSHPSVPRLILGILNIQYDIYSCIRRQTLLRHSVFQCLGGSTQFNSSNGTLFCVRPFFQLARLIYYCHLCPGRQRPDD